MSPLLPQCNFRHKIFYPLKFSPPAYAVEVMFSSCLCVCVFVCVSVCVCVCLSVRAITFEPVDIETSFWYGVTSWPYLGQVWVSRSLGQGQGHLMEMLISLPGHKFNLFWLVWGQGHKLGQGHLKVEVIAKSNCKCLTFYRQAGGGPSTERHSCWDCI